jgi:single-stranded-DNA-specific exonuclease
VLDSACAQIEAAGPTDAPILVAAGPGWHPGVIGVAAGRIKERYGRPAIVIGVSDGIGKGSGRSVPGVDLATFADELSETPDSLIEYINSITQ